MKNQLYKIKQQENIAFRVSNIKRVVTHARPHTRLKYYICPKNIMPKYLTSFTRHDVLHTSIVYYKITKRDSNQASSIPFHDLSPNRTKLFLTRLIDQQI